MSYARASPAVAASNGKIYAIGDQLIIDDGRKDLLMMEKYLPSTLAFGYCAAPHLYFLKLGNLTIDYYSW